ncbi:MAG: phospholipase D family protein [Planctomycetota bacterium]
MKVVSAVLLGLVACVGARAGEVEAHFSPNGGCQAAILREIGAAERRIIVEAYTFTNPLIANALRRAMRRKVEVEIILDATDDETTLATAKSLSLAGIPIRIDSAHGIFHNKIILVDDHTIITGSYNFTISAEFSNAENLIILKGFPEVFEQYWRNYAEHRQHAQVYSASGDKGAPANVRAPAEEDPTVFVTRSGKKYHIAGCPALTEDPIPMRLSEAKAMGYGRCLRCSPPE